MTGDDLRALATAAHLHDLSYAMLVDWLVDHVDALADLLDAARDYMTTEDVGDEWREHARLRLLDALQEADR